MKRILVYVLVFCTFHHSSVSVSGDVCEGRCGRHGLCDNLMGCIQPSVYLDSSNSTPSDVTASRYDVTANLSGIVRCAEYCRGDPDCITATSDQAGTCWLHPSLPGDHGFRTAGYNLFYKHCQGIPGRTHQCHCPHDLYGPDCQLAFPSPHVYRWTFCAGQHLNLRCGPNRHIYLHYVFYGRGRGHAERCGEVRTDDSCRDWTDFNKIHKMCSGKRVCTVKTAVRSLFPDGSCNSGTASLTVLWECPHNNDTDAQQVMVPYNVSTATSERSTPAEETSTDSSSVVTSETSTDSSSVVTSETSTDSSSVVTSEMSTDSSSVVTSETSTDGPLNATDNPATTRATPPTPTRNSHENWIEKVIREKDQILGDRDGELKEKDMYSRLRHVMKMAVTMEKIARVFLNRQSPHDDTSRDYTLTTDNIAVQMSEVDSDSVRFRPSTFGDEAENVEDEDENTGDEVLVFFKAPIQPSSDRRPPLLGAPRTRGREKKAFISFFLYDNLHHIVDDFTPNDTTTVINSRIVSATLVSNFSQRAPELDQLRFTLRKIWTQNTTNPSCVFWNEWNSTWSTAGCHVVTSNRSHVMCSCSHMTCFAILMDVTGQTIHLSAVHERVLTWITYAGCTVSAVSLAACVILFSAFRRIWTPRVTIHRNLSLCLLLVNIVFLAGVDATNRQVLCSVIAGFLHLSLLSAFAWMLAEGIEIYYMLVRVFPATSLDVKWYYLIGYGIPSVIVGVCYIINPTGYGSEKSCWLKTDDGFIWAFTGPVLAIISVNLVVLVLALRTIYSHNASSTSTTTKHGGTESSLANQARTLMKGVLCLTTLLGVTWLVGFLYVSEATLVFAYLFSICNSCQGLAIFVFQCLTNEKLMTNVKNQLELWRQRRFERRRLSESTDSATRTTSK